MSTFKRLDTGLAAALCAVYMATPASAAEILNTGTPGGFLGYYGYDVFVGQSVALAFVTGQDHRLDSLSLWLMSNDSNPGADMRISLQTNAGGGGLPLAPSGTALESWAHATQTAGWQPMLETMNSTGRPLLSANTAYWIVAESTEAASFNPVWVVAGNGNPYYMGNIDFQSGPAWQVGLTGGPVGAVVNASPVPEPGAWLLGLLGAPWIWNAGRRSPSATPRPQSAVGPFRSGRRS